MIDESELIDVSRLVRGWLWVRVFVTKALWIRYILPTSPVRWHPQTEKNRVREINEWLWVAIGDQAIALDSFVFDAEVRMERWPKPRRTVQIKAAVTRNAKGLCHRVTLMLPDED